MKKYICFIIILFLSIIPTLSVADDIEDPFISNSNYLIETSSSISYTPVINARHAVVLDRASKTVLYGKQENDKCKMASTTKVMTAIIVLENCSNLNEQVTISKKAARNWGFKTWFIHK